MATQGGARTENCSRKAKFDDIWSHRMFQKVRISIFWSKRAQELGNEGLYRNYRVYKKSSKFRNFILLPGIQKTDFPDFPRKKFGKKRKNRFFLDSRDQNKIFNIFKIFYMTGIFYINPHFRAPRPVLTQKSAFQPS